MWLITTLGAAAIVTLIWAFASAGIRQGYRLDLLALMLWGATSMIFVDHLLGYEGGEFLEITTDGMITSGALLGAAMLIPVLGVWGIIVLARRRWTGSQK
jgi:hypothetical protein